MLITGLLVLFFLGCIPIFYLAKQYEKANEMGLTYDEYMLFLSIRTLIIKEHFKGKEMDLNERHVYKKLVEILELI